jgi:hypothetical protein
MVLIVTHENGIDMMIDVMMVMITIVPPSLLTYSADEDEGSEYTRDAVCVCLHWSFVHLCILYQLWIDRQTYNSKMFIIIIIIIISIVIVIR